MIDTDLYPWSTVAKVYAIFPDGLEVTGSAVMIGDGQALTAGHVVYDDRHGGWATEVDPLNVAVFDTGRRCMLLDQCELSHHLQRQEADTTCAQRYPDDVACRFAAAPCQECAGRQCDRSSSDREPRQ